MKSESLQAAPMATGLQDKPIPAEKPEAGMPTRRREKVGLVVRHVWLYAVALIFVTPLVYAFFSALKPNSDIFAMPPSLIGSEVRWSNFVVVFPLGPLLSFIINYVFVVVAGTASV